MRIVTAAGFTVLMLAAATAQAGRQVTHEFSITQPKDGILRVIVDVPVAELTVTNGASDSIELTAAAKRDYDDAGEVPQAQKIVDDASLVMRVSGSRAIITPKLGSVAGTWRNRRDIAFNLNLRLPAGTHLEVQQRLGDVSVVGDYGDIDVRLRVGDVKVTTPKKNVKEVNATTKVGDVSTDVGDRLITREGVFPGRTQFYNDGGASALSVSVRVGDVDIKLTR